MTSDNPFEGHPEQPPGVDGDDPGSLPRVVDAATRVLRYVETLGDGLYDVVPQRDGPVLLYGRDLEVVARAARDSVRVRGPRVQLHIEPQGCTSPGAADAARRHGAQPTGGGS
jgi:hypothetical protein